MTTTTPKRRPDYVAYIPVPSRADGQPPRLVRAGCGFTNMNGSIGVLYNLIPLAGQVILVGLDDAVPEQILYGRPTTAPQFEVNHVRGTGQDSFWQVVGDAYHQDGYLAVHAEAWPHDGKVVLTTPKTNS